MRFVMEFDCDNAPFQTESEDSTAAEIHAKLVETVGEVLEDCARRVRLAPLKGFRVVDENGNTIGHARFVE
jgi:hypothetical protein